MRTLLMLTLLLGQTRVDSFNASSVVVTETVLTHLPDGGCAARWCAVVTSDDGGTDLTACTQGPKDLTATVNQNRCAGLAAAGVNRVARQLRFDVDAGSP